MISFIAINLLIYLITIFAIKAKIISDAKKDNIGVVEEELFEKIISLQQEDEDMTKLIPLIPVINVIYATKMIYLFTKHKKGIYTGFYKKEIFYRLNIEDEPIYIEELITNLLSFLEKPTHTSDDLIFLKKTLEVLKENYPSKEDQEHIKALEDRIIEIDEDKIKKLQK